MRFFFFLVLLISISSVNCDWWDSVTGAVSGGFQSASDWVKDSAAPSIRNTWDSARETVTDPETHKNVKDWFADKADKASDLVDSGVKEVKKMVDSDEHN